MLTQVVLAQTVRRTGQKGDIIAVKRGYARNFLIPHGLAKQVTKQEIAMLNDQRQAHQEKLQKAIARGEELKKHLAKKRILLALPANASGTLYGSATVRDIKGALYETYGVDLPEEAITIVAPIKSVGLHLFHIATKEHGDVAMKVKVIPV